MVMQAEETAKRAQPEETPNETALEKEMAFARASVALLQMWFGCSQLVAAESRAADSKTEECAAEAIAGRCDIPSDLQHELTLTKAGRQQHAQHQNWNLTLTTK